MLGLSGSITRAEAYLLSDKGSVERQGLAFRFRSAEGMTVSGIGFELYQNQPNPSVNRTNIGFFLPEASEKGAVNNGTIQQALRWDLFGRQGLPN
jgi:hypothetical protein